MKQPVSMTNLEDFAHECIHAANYPNDNHLFTLYSCHSCHKQDLKITIEHHTGSKEWNFKGIVWGQCTSCGYLGRLFTFTGEHRSFLCEETPECDCGSKIFNVGQCDRTEGEEGITGFFDEGVIAGKCCSCGLNMVFVRMD